MDKPSALYVLSLRDVLLLLPIVLLAMLLRTWQLGEPLWLDELHTAWVVDAGVRQIPERASIGNQSPLYFVLPWATTMLWGTSEWTLRLPSLVAGIALVLAAYVVVLHLTASRIAAVTSSILVSMDHNAWFYATEARPYACVQLVAVVQLVIFISLQRQATRSRRIAFIASTTLLFYLHYTAILLVTGEVVFLMTPTGRRLRHHDQRGYRLNQLAVDLSMLAVMLAPMASHLVNIGGRRDAWTSFINNTSLLLPVHWFGLVPYVVVPALTCIVLLIAIRVCRSTNSSTHSVTRDADGDTSTWLNRSGLSRERSAAVSPTALLLACWLGIPLTIVWLLTAGQIAPLYLSRYVIGAAVAPMLFAGLCVGIWNGMRARVVVACITITWAAYCSGMIQQVRYDGRLFGDRTENWRAAVQYVNDRRQFAGIVFVRSGLLEAERLTTEDNPSLRKYCVLPVTAVYRIDGPKHRIRPLTTTRSGHLSEADVQAVDDAAGAWFLVNGSKATRERCQQQVLESLARRETPFSIWDEQQFGNVGVFRIVLGELDSTGTSYSENSSVRQPTSPNSIAVP